MRSRLPALAAAAVFLLSGCGDASATASGGSASSGSPSSGSASGGSVAPPAANGPVPEAASAGGACVLWDYALIRDKIGVEFTVAAAERVRDTSSCVVQTEGGDYPYLALSVVEHTRADAEVFRDALVPAGAHRLKGVGKAAYRLVTESADGHGPGVEIGWLSEAEQLQTLRYAFAPDAADDAVDRMSANLVALAKTVDTTKG